MATNTNICSRIIAGCYERTILGYDVVELEDNSEEEYELRPTFTDNSHTGCIKVLACNNTFLASGSTDETVHLYNLATNTDVGSLMQHDGSITSLKFFKSTHLMSAGSDGLLCIWNTNNWDCQKVLRGHREAIHSLAVHPSGKLALTASKDKTLRTWNLVNGRPAYTTHIKEVADEVLWSPDGAIYLVIIGDKINIYDITTATITDTIVHSSAIHAVTFIEERIIALGGEGTDIVFYSLEDVTSKPLGHFEAHDKSAARLYFVSQTQAASLQEYHSTVNLCHHSKYKGGRRRRNQSTGEEETPEGEKRRPKEETEEKCALRR
ncbi:putative p21-activated protein kinase-interacting protein 1-like isoform X1 [Apostichopus japonicus]|uniref:Putative p21-activated protein kinase-interacting protein 1-like isoform X1 n=1 Tax=Stichopus japonicus TaxID=307972 RepID=A0A2G8JRP4_STIJA|nr:putative p21-activated protein kinase-interacting protein 1-like isoform X1 [Apostichopus japonicus]